MNTKFKTITGMNDILPDEVGLWQWMEETTRKIFESYGFSEIRVPIMEDTSLFSRGIGENSQVVQKEMYTFDDKGGDSVTLRPEGTASVVRAYLQHSLAAQDAITKLYYSGPMFRYERPQKGRLRQFHQIGAEIIGVDTPLADAEVVIMLDRWVRALGIQDYQLEVNSIGRIEERKQYIDKLVAYFSPYKNDLSDNDKKRLDKNPLRMFDSKDEKCRQLCQDAPKILEELSPESQADFEQFQKYLDEAQVSYEVNPFIVRGLDYYEKTAFEFVSPLLGAQDAFAGGGRYNHLVKELGGGDVPAVGFAIGCERVILLLQETQGERTVQFKQEGIYFAPMNELCFAKCRELLQNVRDEGMPGEMAYQITSLKSQMRRANKLNYQYVGIMGDDELAKGLITLKNLQSGEQKQVSLQDLIQNLT